MSIEAEQAGPAPRPAHPNSWVYFDGEFLRYHDVHLGLMTHALHYGTGCFEGIRAYWSSDDGRLMLLQPAAHYDRLRRSGRLLGMELPGDTGELVETTVELLRRNGYKQDVYVRPLLFKSSEEIGVRLHGLSQSFAIYTATFGKYIDVDGGVRCMVSSWRRSPDVALPSRAKITGSYVNSALAKSEAVASGFDEAITLTLDGHVAEGSAENLFMLKEGAFVTPPVTDDILEGITRRLLMGLIRDELGLPVVERSIDRSELYVCDELLLCGTGAQISGVVELDHRKIGEGVVGEFTHELQEIYFAAVRGKLPKYAAWTLPVY